MRQFVFLSLLSMLVLIFSTAAQAFTIDGNLDDWGVNPSADDWEPSDPSIARHDDHLMGSGGYVNPGWGGQPFNAEAMYALGNSGDGYLYVAVVTGTPDTGAPYNGTTYAPGDLAINFGGGLYEFGIETTGNGPFAQGAIVRTPDEDDWSVPTDFPDYYPASILDGTAEVETATVVYNDTSYGADHWVIEMAIPIQPFVVAGLWGNPFTLWWTMECGNDFLELENPAPVPEPATSLLLGIGIAAIAAARRKSKLFK